MREHNELDRMIDEGLTTFGEPRVRLEERVLNNVVLHASRKRRARMWTIALPLAACIALALLLPRPTQRIALIPGQSPTLESRRSNRDAAKKASGAAFRARSVSALKKVRTVRVAATVSAPKLDVFPTPLSLTPQEKAFLNFATIAPQKERDALLKTQQDPFQPIHIDPIQISTIYPPADGGD